MYSEYCCSSLCDGEKNQTNTLTVKKCVPQPPSASFLSDSDTAAALARLFVLCRGLVRPSYIRVDECPDGRACCSALKVEHWAKLPLYRLKNTLITQQHSALLLLLEEATRMHVCV